MSCGNFIKQDILNIKGQLLSYKSDIVCQTEQLLNAKDALLQFQRNVIEKYKTECILLEQMMVCGDDEAVSKKVMKDLNVSEREIEDGEVLEDIEMVDVNDTEETTEREVVTPTKSDISERKKQDKSINLTLEMAPQRSRRQNSSASDSGTSVKKVKTADSPGGGTTTDRHAAKRITDIVVTTKFIYISGSGGLLARISTKKGDTFIYDTDTNNDVSNVTVTVVKKSELLIATTTEDVLIYNSVGATPVCILHMPGIRRLVSIALLIHFVLDDGSIRTLNLKNYSVNDAAIYVCGNIRDLYPTTKFPKKLLLTLKDSEWLHGASLANDYRAPRVVAGVRHVIGVANRLDGTSLCYSDDTVWLIDTNFKVEHSVILQCGIKLVHSAPKHILVVVDRVNRVHIYSSGLSLCHSRAIVEDVTAVTVSGSQVFIAAGNLILNYDYTLTEEHDLRMTAVLPDFVLPKC